MRAIAQHDCSRVMICVLFWLLCNHLGAEPLDKVENTAVFLQGGDISALAKIEECGGTYRDQDGKARDLISILSEQGCNCARLRLFVNPNHESIVVNDLGYTVDLAKRIRSAGMIFLLDIHYSDTWADPGKQFKPAEWNQLSFSELEKQVKSYTESVITEFKKQGVMPSVVQIGNEVTNGMLWPDGKIIYGSRAEEEKASWNRFCRLLNAGIQGVHSALSAQEQIQIMIHIDRGADWPATKNFFDHLSIEKIDFDMIGLSYYPWWHGDLENLKHNLKQSAERFKKPIVVVETGYPHRGNQWGKKSYMNWDISERGQSEFLNDVVRVVQQTPNHLGRGVLYWYPEAIPVDNLDVWEGGAIGLFGKSGQLLPAISAFEGKKTKVSQFQSGNLR